jgi:hypothetical protein
MVEGKGKKKLEVSDLRRSSDFSRIMQELVSKVTRSRLSAFFLLFFLFLCILCSDVSFKTMWKCSIQMIHQNDGELRAHCWGAEQLGFFFLHDLSLEAEGADSAVQQIKAASLLSRDLSVLAPIWLLLPQMSHLGSRQEVGKVDRSPGDFFNQTHCQLWLWEIMAWRWGFI